MVGKKDPLTLCSYEDVNFDGFTDLVCHFLTTDIAGVDGESTAAGASEPVSTEFARQYNTTRVPSDATAPVGPATVDLITEFALLRYCRAETAAIETWRRRATAFLLRQIGDAPEPERPLAN